MPKLRLSSLTAQDIVLYYKDSFVRVLGLEKEPVWKKVAGLNHKSDLIFMDGRARTTVPKATWRRTLTFHSWFPTGFFNFKDYVLWCERIPIRQVIQGITTQNFNIRTGLALAHSTHKFLTGMTSPLAAHFKEVMLPESAFPWTGQAFTTLFEAQKYPTDIAKAIDEVRRGAAFARAMSPEFAIFPHPTTVGCVFVLRQSVVAESTNVGNVKLLSRPFAADVAKYLDGTSISLTTQ